MLTDYTEMGGWRYLRYNFLPDLLKIVCLFFNYLATRAHFLSTSTYTWVEKNDIFSFVTEMIPFFVCVFVCFGFFFCCCCF